MQLALAHPAVPVAGSRSICCVQLSEHFSADLASLPQESLVLVLTPCACELLQCCLQWSNDNRVDLDSLLQELPVPVLKQVLAALLPKGHPAIQAVGAYASSTGGPNKAAVISSIQVADMQQI
jgi:hypothetical protein